MIFPSRERRNWWAAGFARAVRRRLADFAPAEKGARVGWGDPGPAAADGRAEPRPALNRAVRSDEPGPVRFCILSSPNGKPWRAYRGFMRLTATAKLSPAAGRG